MKNASDCSNNEHMINTSIEQMCLRVYLSLKIMLKGQFCQFVIIKIQVHVIK